MRYYETISIIQPDLGDDGVGQVTRGLTNIIERDGGELVQLENWGKKRLAFSVKKFRYGTFVVHRYGGNDRVVDEVGRYCRFSDDIIRDMTVRLSARPDATQHRSPVADDDDVAPEPRRRGRGEEE
ncbi:MAG: 30S ribosomal protein S6 [Candidatus Schekmanbacteria bacterium]|nr:30S ribosomal protein S6 [Candidatus Schekmanbacteria bacterium]